MHNLKLIPSTLFCLLILPYSQAQDPSRPRVIDPSNIRVTDLSKLSDTVEKERVVDYLNGLDQEIGRLAELYPQLSDWSMVRKGDAWTDAGKRRTEASLEYARSLKLTKSTDYLEGYGPGGFHLRVRVLTQRQFSRLAGAGVGTVIYGASLGNGCVVADVMSANPKVPELEKRITDLIRTGTSQQYCY